MDNAPQQSVNKRTSTSVKSRPWQLADQYLDTMVMDDDWRNTCLRQISEGRRYQGIIKQIKGQHPSFSLHDHLKSPAKVRSKRKIKSDPVLDKSPISLKSDRASSTGPSSDSGFFSCSPTPNSPTIVGSTTRSTRSTRTDHKFIARSVNDQPRKDGRRCLSCKSPNTSCWRQALGGTICNSCGLR